jgi:DNA-binding NarL/FixJ family response regulator
VNPLEKRPAVLVVDDDELFREAISDLLEEFSCSVVGHACDGAEGVQMADRLAPDVVLMDMRMPALDGIAATRIIRERHPSMQVVILSAYDDPGFKRDAAEAGVCAYLLKGCAADAIGSTVHDAFELHLSATLDFSGPEARE